MDALDLMPLFHHRASSPEVEAALTGLGTLTRPALDEENPGQHYDWVLVRRRGMELGFVDRAYLEAEPEYRWGHEDNLSLAQLTFYGAGARDDVAGYAGALPHGLTFGDSRQTARQKLAAFDATRRSYHTDCWDCDAYRLVLAYRPDDAGIETVHLKLASTPWPEDGRAQPHVDASQWLGLFGEPVESPVLTHACAPLDLAAKIADDEDERELDFTRECGLELYFEDARNLRLARPVLGSGLVFGGVKFYRARDREARQWAGPLPFDLAFEDTPDALLAKVPAPPAKHVDGRLTGHALWHLPALSLHVLYSTLENHLFRVTLMAPGYWTDMTPVA